METIVPKFRAVMQEEGLTPPEDMTQGKIYRFPGVGKNNGNTSGWCLVFPDGRGGAFGDWSTGLNRSWCSIQQAESGVYKVGEKNEGRDRDMRELSEAKMFTRQTEAASQAKEIWESSATARDAHPYLAGKRIKSHGLRQMQDGRLIIPLHDVSGALHSLQYIAPDGIKRFQLGARIRGCFFAFGGELADIVCVCEGYATAATVHEATSYPVVVAFAAGNLAPVAKALRLRFPDVKLIVCADDDAWTEGNPGLSKATEATLLCSGVLAIPAFKENRPKGATDFNDMAKVLGIEAVKAAIEHAVIEAPAVSVNDEDWPDPKPIQQSLLPVPKFDPDALLPEILRDWVVDEADRMPCPPDFVAAALLVALGSVIGTQCAIRPKAHDTWLVVPNLWGGIVGEPSAKKTPAISAALKPLERLIALAGEKHRMELEAFETEGTIHEARCGAIDSRLKAAAKDSKKGNLEDLAKELLAQRRGTRMKPVLRRYKTNDSTVEKLGELLRDNPVGLLVMRDELVGLLASWEKFGREGDRAFFLEAWSGCNGFDTDRIGRGTISIPNHCISVFGGIQPDKLTGYLEQTENELANDGMLQRMQILVFPDQLRWEWRDRKPNKSAYDQVVAIFEVLSGLDAVAWGAMAPDNTSKFPHVGFCEEAQDLFVAWLTSLHHLKLLTEGQPIMAQHLTKYEKLFPAIALILHLVDCAATRRGGAVSSEAAHYAAAWCDYLEAHARRCYGLLKDGGYRATQALAEKIRKGKLVDRFTGRDVRRNQWRDLTSEEMVRAALDWLEDEGWLRGESVGGVGPGSGRRTMRYRINPKAMKGKEK